MRVLMSGDWGVDEAARWRSALQAVLPQARWVLDDPGVAPAAQPAVDAAVVANPPPGRLQGRPGLRLIQSLWAGVDRLLADPTLPEGVPIARMVDPAMNAAMAETALWAVLALQRGFFAYDRQQREGLWRALPQRRADECRVGVLGLGQMGATVAARLAGQGYPVRGWRLQPGAAPAAGPAWREDAGRDALPGLLADSDVVINLLPLTAATCGLIDAGFLARLPAGAALVNLARGAHVVEADLLAALDSGRLAHAVLDVFATEPLPPGHRFWRHPAVTVLPHAAAQTDPRSAAAVVAGNLRALAEGRPVSHLVTRERGY